MLESWKMTLGVIFGVNEHLRVKFWFGAYDGLKFAYFCTRFFVWKMAYIYIFVFLMDGWREKGCSLKLEDKLHIGLIPNEILCLLNREEKNLEQLLPIKYLSAKVILKI